MISPRDEVLDVHIRRHARDHVAYRGPDAECVGDHAVAGNAGVLGGGLPPPIGRAPQGRIQVIRQASDAGQDFRRGVASCPNGA